MCDVGVVFVCDVSVVFVCVVGVLFVCDVAVVFVCDVAVVFVCDMGGNGDCMDFFSCLSLAGQDPPVPVKVVTMATTTCMPACMSVTVSPCTVHLVFSPKF